jgi:hypothetical protein
MSDSGQEREVERRKRASPLMANHWTWGSCRMLRSMARWKNGNRMYHGSSNCSSYLPIVAGSSCVIDAGRDRRGEKPPLKERSCKRVRRYLLSETYATKAPQHARSLSSPATRLCGWIR